MDDLALGVEVVEALEDLLHHDLHIGQIDSLVVASDYELEQVVAQHLIKKAFRLDYIFLYLNQINMINAPTSKTMQTWVPLMPLILKSSSS